MKKVILVMMLTIGIHGVRHNLSGKYIDIKNYNFKKHARVQRILNWDNNNLEA